MGKLGYWSEEKDILKGDHASTGTPDALEAMLERTYDLLQRPALHSHTCRVCGHLRPCLQQPCMYRATDSEASWVCGGCLPGEEPR